MLGLWRGRWPPYVAYSCTVARDMVLKQCAAKPGRHETAQWRLCERHGIVFTYVTDVVGGRIRVERSACVT